MSTRTPAIDVVRNGVDTDYYKRSRPPRTRCRRSSGAGLTRSQYPGPQMVLFARLAGGDRQTAAVAVHHHRIPGDAESERAGRSSPAFGSSQTFQNLRPEVGRHAVVALPWSQGLGTQEQAAGSGRDGEGHHLHPSCTQRNRGARAGLMFVAPCRVGIAAPPVGVRIFAAAWALKRANGYWSPTHGLGPLQWPPMVSRRRCA